MNTVIKYLLFGIIILFFQSNSFSQDKTIDSLKLALKKAIHDTVRCNILNELAETANIEEWPGFNDQLLKLSKKNVTQEANTKLKFFYLKYVADALNNSGYLAYQKGDIKSALNNYQKSLKIGSEIQDENRIASSLNNISLAYNKLGETLKALDYLHKSLKLYEKKQDKYGIAMALNNISGIYKSQGDTEKALELLRKSLKLQEEIKDEEGMANTLNNIGIIYSNRNEFSMALAYCLKCLRIMEKIQNKYGVAHSLLSVGLIYKHQGDLPKALEHYQNGLVINEEINDKEGIVHSTYYLAALNVTKGQLDKALSYGKRSLKIAKEIGYPAEIKIASVMLYDIYKRQNRPAQALEMYEQYIKMRDSITNEETRKATYKQQIKYEYAQKEALLKVEQEKREVIQRDEIKFQKLKINIAIAVIIIMIISVFFIFSTHTQKRKAVHRVDIVKKVSEVELKALRAQMNPHFVFNSLNTIQSFIMNKDYTSATYYLGSFSSLLRMILQNSFKKLIPLEQELKFLKTYTDLEKLRFDNKFQVNISVKESIEALAVHVPPMIIQPIIENAFKHGLMHRIEGGVLNIAFDCSPNKDQLICVVEDNGIGRTKSQEIESWKPIDYQSKGIEITESRIEMLNLNRSANLYSIQVFDLYNINSEGCGTKVEIKFPLN